MNLGLGAQTPESAMLIVAGAWFRIVPQNCRVLDLEFDVGRFGGIGVVEPFPRIRKKSDINCEKSFHVETVALMSRTEK